MRTLHEEAIEQLELMKTALDAAEEAVGTFRDTLEAMATNHWNAYLDTVHMIALHDEAMANVLKKYGLAMREQPENSDERLGASPALLALLLIALIRRHRRIWHIYGWRAGPMGDYLKESLVMEREHVAELIAMIQSLL
jgi:hypothetical protein